MSGFDKGSSSACGKIFQVIRHRAFDDPEGLDHAPGYAAGCPDAVLAGNDVPSVGIQKPDDLGEIVYNLSKVDLMKKSDHDRREDFDAVFVGTGAPRGKNLEIPGRYDSDRIHIGIEWLESVAFDHIDEIGEPERLRRWVLWAL